MSTTTDSNHNGNNEDDQETESMVDSFDSLCVSFGDIDCMTSFVSVPNQSQNDDTDLKQEQEQYRQEEQPVCYLELQEYSKALAAQLVRRFRPDYVLVDCQQKGIPEAVAVLACMRLRVPFVPVSVQDFHSGGRLDSIVQTLRGAVEKLKAGAADTTATDRSPRIVAVTCCENDQDPLLGVFQKADVHQILFLDPQGNLREALDVPQSLCSKRKTHLGAAPQLGYSNRDDDALYVLFTSGTSEKNPKAVLGSHESTRRRIDWFLQTFPPSRRICRRSKLTFVDGVTELLSGLLSFESLLVCPDPIMLQNQGIAAVLLSGETSAKCTQVTLLPSQLQQLLLVLEDDHQRHKVDEKSSIKNKTPPVYLGRVIVSGEACPVQVLESFRRLLPLAELINLYGQTETTGDVTCAVLTDMTHPVVRGVVSVGKPILECISIRSDNESNELIVRGNLSNGYWRGNMKEKQWVNFATGDVGFQDADGNWFIQGRKDDVVKIDGILTIPSEAEAAMNDTFGNKVQVAVSIMGGAVYALVNQPIEFSRQRMHEKGVPWHLIPRKVFKVNEIPTSSTSGAGKMDRNCVRDMVKAKLIDQEQNENTRMPTEKRDLNAVLTEVLQYNDKIVDSSSFVELGGDSALAVGLLYQLRISGLLSPTSNLSAMGILQSKTIADLREMLGSSSAPSKRLKRSDSITIRPFAVLSLKQYSKYHGAVDLRACVDASPIVHNESIYAACQGGIVLRVKGNNVLAAYDLVQHGTNWMVQAGMVILGDTLVVCAYHRASSEGLIVGLNLDLGKAIWEFQLDEPAKIGPTIVNDMLWIPLETKFALVSPVSANQKIRYAPGNSKSKIVTLGRHGIAYISNKEWTANFSIIQLDDSCNILSQQQHEDTFWNPCLENFVALGDTRFVVTDRCGYLYIVTLEGDSIETQQTRLSESFLSAPLVVKDAIIVGGNDGILRCVSTADIEHEVWTIDVGACILAAPLSLNMSIIVCTTAGDVIEIQDGKVVFKYQINGEIWSNPVAGVSNGQVAFGARDSRLHLLDLKRMK